MIISCIKIALALFLSAISLFAGEAKLPLNMIYGEELIYKVSWFKIYGGDLKLNTSLTTFKGKKCLKIKASVISAKWFSRLYYIEDHVTAYIDPKNFNPLIIKVDYREGKRYRRKADYIFDYQNRLVSEMVNDKVKKKISLPEDSWIDLFTAYLKIRFTPPEPGKTINKNVTDGRKFYSVAARRLQKKKIIETRDGKKNCLVIIPQKMKFAISGQKQSPEKIKLYLEDSPDRIPWLIIGDIKIGQITAKLYSRKKTNS